MCDKNVTLKQQPLEEPLKSVWLITNKTNLHIGDEGATSFGIIDKSIQRDALTGIPCINSSSLKGAINEYCCNGKNKIVGDIRKNIFGSDKAPSNNDDKKSLEKEYRKGSTIFFDAHLLFLPRQNNTTLYELVYCKEYLESFISKAKALGITVTIEQLKTGHKNLKNESISIERFNEYCSELELPIIARNVLKDGESQNLWYEQYIPSEAIFGTLLISNNIKAGNALESTLIKEDTLVQIGANATIGYGYCKFKKL